MYELAGGQIQRSRPEVTVAAASNRPPTRVSDYSRGGQSIKIGMRPGRSSEFTPSVVAAATVAIHRDQASSHDVRGAFKLLPFAGFEDSDRCVSL